MSTDDQPSSSVVHPAGFQPHWRASPAAAESWAREFEEALAAGRLGYYARLLVQTTLPHSAAGGSEYERRNGNLTLTLLAPSRIGLPYGSIPRLLLSWVATEAVRTKERELLLGTHLSAFMEALELVPTGGRWGTIPRLRQQMTRTFATTFSAHATGPGVEGLATTTIADRAMIFWDPLRPDQAALWHSTVTLSQPFFDSIIHGPVPISLAALRFLRRSPLAIDLYMWLTYRMSYLRQPTVVPWGHLEGQFGCHYARPRDFRAKLNQALRKVLTIYPEARVEIAERGLELRPSPSHIAPLQRVR